MLTTTTKLSRRSGRRNGSATIAKLEEVPDEPPTARVGEIQPAR